MTSPFSRSIDPSITACREKSGRWPSTCSFPSDSSREPWLFVQSRGRRRPTYPLSVIPMRNAPLSGTRRAFAALPFVSASLLAQGGAATVGENVQVSKALATAQHDEVLMTADPNDPMHLLACSTYRP